jgi:uncharacterized membrane protein
MKVSKKIASYVKKAGLCFLGTALSVSAFAEDKLAGALSGDVQDMLGSNGTLWKLFILVDIILASAAAIKAKNPLVFLAVFFVVFIPGLLIKAFVF